MIAWTDERVLVFGEAHRRDLGDADLYRWWLSAGPVVQGSPSEKDPGVSVPRPPRGTYLTTVSDRDGELILKRFPNLGFPFQGSFGMRLWNGAYTVSQLGRFGGEERGTYVVSKGQRLVLTSACTDRSDGSAAYVWRTLGDGSVEWTLAKTYGSASTTGQNACVPGPWPITLRAWTRAPTGEVAYSSAQNQLVRLSLDDLQYSALTPTSGTTPDSIQPVWSPDGSRIAFTSNRDGDYDLYVMDPDGSNIQQLTDDPGDDLDPAWSPDGTMIAYHQGPPLGAAGSTELTVLHLVDGSVRNLVERTENVARPSWSPDGSRIVFEVNPGDPQRANTFYIVNADGSGLTRLARERGVDILSTWSPDGRRIVFRGNHGPTGPGLFTMRPNGKDLRPFGTSLPPTDDPDAQGVPSWSPDGRWLVIGGVWDHPSPLYLVSADGAHVFVLEPSAAEPSWRPAGS